MKRFICSITFIIGKISLLLATFLIGLVVTLLWFELYPPIVTLCELAKNPKQYQGKTVRLVTPVQTSHGFFYFRDDSCNLRGADAVIDLPEDYQSKSAQVQDFLSVNNKNFLSGQMMITGEIDTTRKYHDISPKFVIKATELELTSEVTVEPADK